MDPFEGPAMDTNVGGCVSGVGVLVGVACTDVGLSVGVGVLLGVDICLLVGVGVLFGLDDIPVGVIVRISVGERLADIEATEGLGEAIVAAGKRMSFVALK